jgi:hypothetical protein
MESGDIETEATYRASDCSLNFLSNRTATCLKLVVV